MEYGVNGMLEMANGKVLIYGSFANILTGRPIGNQIASANHHIYDVGCFAVLNSDGSLDTTFNNTAEMSSYLYPVLTNAPAPWDNGEVVRPYKDLIAPVGFQYASHNNPNNGTLSITFAKIIDNKLYVSLSREGLVSYNRTHLLDGSKLYRINLNDLTLDETCDFRSFADVRDIISTGNGYRVYLANVYGNNNIPNKIYNHRWSLAFDDDFSSPDSYTRFIAHRLYSMKWDKGLGGYMMESSRSSVGQIIPDWNQVGGQISVESDGILIFNVNEVNKSEISFHVLNETIQHIQSMLYGNYSMLEQYKYDFQNLSWDRGFQAPSSKSYDVDAVSKFYRGLDLNENDLDKYEAFKTLFRMKYTSEDVWFDLSSHKMEPIDGEFVGYTPFALGNGLDSGEYSISEYLPEFPNYIPAVPTLNILKGYTASQGDITKVIEIGDEYIYLNGKWVNYYSTNLEDLDIQARGFRDAKTKSINELILSLKPFTYAAYHIPKANLSEYIQSL